jgi:hypothetical protein
MKRILLIATGICFTFVSLTAKEVTVDRASKVAANMFYLKAASQYGVEYGQLEPQLVYTCDSAGNAVYYVFGMANLTGFVIIAGDDAVYPVIGYSAESSYLPDEFDQPPAFVSYMDMVKKTIMKHITGNLRSNADIDLVWYKMEHYTSQPSESPMSSVLPLTTSLWGQGCNYNADCPATGGIHPAGQCDHVLTGCVATAMAIIMKYWNFPAHGTGSNSYIDPANTTSSCPLADPSYGTISATFNTDYNWWNMPDNPTSASTGIPSLMSDCGVAVNMNYAYCTSGAWPSGSPVVANAFKNYFYYASSAVDVLRSSYSDTQWYNLLKSDLNNNRPVDYGNISHSWVCDGYEDNYNGTGQTWFHMNWGWNGGSNGYFTLDTNSVGTLQEAVIGIVPTYQNPLAPTEVEASQGDYSGIIYINWHWASNASHYKVYRSTVNNSTTSVGISGWQSNTSYQDNTMLPSTNYYYWVRSATSSGGANASGYGQSALGYTAVPTALVNGVSVYNSESPRYMTFTNANNYWAAVGIKPSNSSEDWDISMYTDNTFSTVAVTSMMGNGYVDFVVVDGNHTSLISRGLKLNHYAGSFAAMVEFDGGPDQLYVGENNNITWNASDVLNTWDVYLTPGIYEFKLTINSGYLNSGLAVFSSAGGTYYYGRPGAIGVADATGNGEPESLTVVITATDYYGFIVWGNNPASCNYNVSIERAGTWTGAVDNNWHNAGNWSANYIPTSDLDVTIPEMANQPWIWTGNAYCHNLTLEAGTENYLRIYDNVLNITGNADFYAQFMMDNPVVTAQCNVSGHLYWRAGSSAWMTNGTSLNVYGNMEILSGANVHLLSGSVNFYGNTTNYIYCHDNTSYFYDINIYKSAGTGVWYSYSSTRSFHIKGDLYISSNSSFVCNSDSSLYLSGNLYSAGTFQCYYGGVRCVGTSQYLTLQADNYFNELVIAATGPVYCNSDLIINRDINIFSGTLCSNSYTLKVAGNWNNTAGTSSFSEASGRVVINGGNYHQYCTDEDFYLLEVNKPSGAAFRMDGTHVTCQHYDWTAGAVDVLSGSFTALSLVDNGISGAFYVNPGGTIELHNTSGYVDLNGDLYIFGGNVDIYGGTTDSYWPYIHNASITMTGGVLDFKETGIRLYNTASYSLSENIVAGVIRTTGSLYADRPEFTPSGGLVELYGPYNANLTTTNGANLVNLDIGKSGSSAVSLNSSLQLNGNLSINSGVLNSNSHVINLSGNWTNLAGDAGFTEASGTVHCNGANASIITTGETFYNLNINKTFAGENAVALSPGQSLNVLNTLNISDGTLKPGDNTVLNLRDLNIALNTGLNASSYAVALNITGNWSDYNSMHNTSTGFLPGNSSTVTFQQGANQSMTTTGPTEPFCNLIINKTVGNFIPAAGVEVSHDFSLQGGIFDCASSGLIHYFNGNFTVLPAANWYACQQTVYFIGSADQVIHFAPSSGYFNHVVIDKSNGSSAALSHDCISLNNGSLTVDEGLLDLAGFYYRCTGSVTINNGGFINIPASSWLEVGNNYNLTVNSGGTLELLGNLTDPAKVTHHSGYYNLNIESGGVISAEHAVFEYTGMNGLYIKSGALVDALHPFTGCTFRYGLAGGCLMRVDNNQVFTVNDAVFPVNSWGGAYNVKKSLNQGMVNFISYNGDFGGESFEDDAFSLVNWTPAGANQLSGTLSYDNAAGTPLSNTKVMLKSGNIPVDSSLTNSSGYYLFDNVPPGNYTLDGKCSKLWGGVNSTDALKIMRHFVHISLLSGIRKTAADVDASNYINAIDAMTAMQRFVEQISSFPSGDWAFEKPALALSGGMTTVNFKGLCFGDVDGTYTPPAKQEPSVQFREEGIMPLLSGKSLELPIKVTRNMSVGAVSMELIGSLPGLTIQNVRVSRPGETVTWKAQQGKVRIAWASLVPLDLKEGEVLLLLELLLEEPATTSFSGPCFNLGSEGELADQDAGILYGEVLELPEVIVMEHGSGLYAGECYPNPFTQYTYLPIHLPEEGEVSISVNDAAGRQIVLLQEGKLAAGSHIIKINRDGLSPGIYSLSSVMSTLHARFIRSQKIIVTR